MNFRRYLLIYNKLSKSSFNTTKLIKYEGSSIPIVDVRDNIEGFLDRNTYYNLINFALENKYIDKDFLYLPSNNIKHIIGKID